MAVNGHHATNGNTNGYLVAFPALPQPLQQIYKPGQMYKYHSKLLKRPVPPLKQTLTKYLKTLDPLLTSEEMKKTKSIVAEFGKEGGIGEKLQQILLERAKTHDNWLADWWLREKYLAVRWSAIRGNASACFVKQPSDCRENYVRSAATFIIAYVKLFQLAHTESIPPDMYAGTPLCMEQYRKLYGYRAPGAKIDSAWYTGPESKHLIIMRKGHLYKVNLLEETSSGELDMIPPSHLVKVINQILDDAKEPFEYPVGVLTGDTRDAWYSSREELMKDPINQQSLACIEKAFIMFCLDDPHPHLESVDSFSDAQLSLSLSNILHGNGTHFNSCNRWHDSAAQIICGEDGAFGAVLEHSNADGPTGGYSCEFCGLFKTPNNKFNYDVFQETSPNVDPASLKLAQKLKWTITPEIIKAIGNSKNYVDKMVRDADLQVFSFKDFGKNFPKSMKISPDAFVQLALQLTNYKMTGKPVAMENFAGTRGFKEGRIDIIRSTTSESLGFLKAMVDEDVPVQTKAIAMAAAVKAYAEVTKDARAGQGVDEHLLGLQVAAEQAGMDDPEIFLDEAYTRSTSFLLDTSQLPFPSMDNFSTYTPLMYEGYGICYNPHEDKCLISVCSFRDCPDTDSMVFGSTFVDSMREMRDMLLKVKVAQ